MTKQEFERIAGYEVTYEDYTGIIEPMYYATNLNKADFVKTINRKRFALKPLKTIVKEMKAIAQELKETCTHYTDYDKKDQLDELVKEYINRKYDGFANFIIYDEEKFACYYPKTVDIYGTDYKTIEKIELN